MILSLCEALALRGIYIYTYINIQNMCLTYKTYAHAQEFEYQDVSAGLDLPDVQLIALGHERDATVQLVRLVLGAAVFSGEKEGKVLCAAEMLVGDV